MKTYNRYMDGISVSDSLHERIMTCTKEVPKDQSIMRKRYTAAFTWLAVVLLGVFIMANLIQNNGVPSPNVSSKYRLDFNKADRQSGANIYIPGHFWQELSPREIKKIFPLLENTHTIKATVNFQSNKGVASLFNIDGKAKSKSGVETYIQIAPGEVILDYGFDRETKSSEILGTAVTGGYFETKPNSKGLKNVIYFATFKLSDVAYYVELGGAAGEREILKKEVTELIGLLIEGGPAPLDIFNPVIPELRDDKLSLDEARSDIDFGSYLPKEIPAGFVFEYGWRFINQVEDMLLVDWRKGLDFINWQVSLMDDEDKTRITPIADTRNYHLKFYPIPWADSVPEELTEIVYNPIFHIEELTMEVVKARTYEMEGGGEDSGPRMNFSVLYGKTLVELNVKGVSPEVIFEMLQQIKK